MRGSYILAEGERERALGVIARRGTGVQTRARVGVRDRWFHRVGVLVGKG